MSAQYTTKIMNCGGMDLLNFLDIRDKDGDPTSMYDDLKDPKHGLDSGREGTDLDELGGLVRKESRIPVAIRRLRSRTDRSNPMMPLGDGQSTPHSPRLPNTESGRKLMEDWHRHSTWGATLAGEKDRLEDPKSKLVRMHRRKSAPAHQLGVNNVSASGGVANNGGGSGQHFMCPKCGRSCIMINRDGVYVAFSVGVTPLVLLCLFFVCVVFGWLGLGCGVGPAVLRKLRLPATERQRPRGIIGRWFNKESHY